MFQKYTHHRWLALPHFLHLRRLPYWFLLSTVLVLGAWIRLLWFGSLQSTLFEGHEANYLIYFEHLDTPNVGDTANYPAMQWWWYLWGFVVPKTETAALLISVCTGLASILVLSESLRRLTQRTWPALMLGVLLCTHPLHVAWSTSIYNVMPPFFFIGLGIYFMVSPKRGGLLSLLSGICLGIAIGMRIEVGIVGLVFVGLCHHLAVPMRQWIGFVLATVFMVFLLIVQTVMANEIPGSGEHELALSMNLGLDAYWAPYSGMVLLILLINALLF